GRVVSCRKRITRQAGAALDGPEDTRDVPRYGFTLLAYEKQLLVASGLAKYIKPLLARRLGSSNAVSEISYPVILGRILFSQLSKHFLCLVQVQDRFFLILKHPQLPALFFIYGVHGLFVELLG